MPHAAEWASRFTSGVQPSAKQLRRRAAPNIVHDAAQGIAQACVPNPDEMLHDLLVQAIDECAKWIDQKPHRSDVDAALWMSACRHTG